MASKKVKTLKSEEIEPVIELMDGIIDDPTVPRNIRKAIEDARNKVLSEGEEVVVKVGAAIYMLDDVSNDINMPRHTRTDIWSIISELESIKEKYK